MSMRKGLVLAALAVLVAVVAGVTGAPADVAVPARTVYMSAVEYKGGANVADELFPPAEEPGTLPLEPVGGDYGYRLKAPDASGRWEVSSYRFEPGIVVVPVGQRTTLEIAGINGSRHDAMLVSPTGRERNLVVTRGRLTRLTFRPRKAGLWLLVCHTHQPGMMAQILAI